MSVAERLFAVAFLSAVLAVYALAGIILIAPALRGLGWEFRFPASIPRPVRGLALAVAGAGVLCMAYGRFVEPYRLEVTHVHIASRKLPPGTGPLRIAHFSDLHCDPKVRLEGRL